MSLRHANEIDVLAHDPVTDEVVMTMIEPRPWDGSDGRVFELQEKLNAYLSFALDGEMNEQIPELAGKKVRLQLDCLQELDEKMAHFVEIIQRQVALQGVPFTVRVVADLPPEEEEDHRHDDGSPCCGGHGHGQGQGHCGCSGEAHQ